MADVVDPDAVKTALNDMDWPASKEAIVEHVESRGGTPETVRAVRSLPLADYDNVNEVLRSFQLPG